MTQSTQTSEQQVVATATGSAGSAAEKSDAAGSPEIETGSDSGVMEKSEALLGQLEERMNSLNELVAGLRNDNVALKRKLADDVELQARLSQDNANLQAKIVVLQGQKEKTIQKLETLLARFNVSGQ